MSRSKISGAMRIAALPLAAGAALLLATFVNFLTYNGYPLLRADVAIVAAGILLLSGVMAPIYAVQKQWGRSLLEGLLAAFFVDLNSDSVAAIVVAGLGVAGFTYLRKTTLLGPMAIIGAVVLVTTPLIYAGRASWIAHTEAPSAAAKPADRPDTALVHIILDAHIGIEGLSADGLELKSELKSFYEQGDFVLYGRAYSEHFHTATAIPHMLNYGQSLGHDSDGSSVIIHPTTHLKRLADLGYRLNIFQSDFADFCASAPPAECVTYNSSSPAPLLRAPLSTVERAQVLAAKMLALSAMVMEVNKGAFTGWHFSRRLGVQIPRVPSLARFGRTPSVGALEALDLLAARLGSAQPGDAYFAHILVPHYPYVVRDDCSYLPRGKWKERHPTIPAAERRQAYANQVRCTTAKLGAALEALEASPAGGNAIVIVHGDHGSRITQQDPVEENFGRFADSDVIAGFSTLFAVKVPGGGSSYIPEPASVSTLLGDFAASRFAEAPRVETSAVHAVNLDDRSWKPTRRISLPPSWLGASR